MSVVSFKRYRCDNCGKEKEVKDEYRSYDIPNRWYKVEVYQYKSGMGTRVFHKEVCSEKCAKEVIKKVKRFPVIKEKPRPLIVHP